MYAWLQLPPQDSCRHAAAPDEPVAEPAEPVRRCTEEPVVPIAATTHAAMAATTRAAIAATTRAARARRPARLGVLVAIAMLAGLAGSPSASAASFSAHGSAEQVYVTGLAPGAGASLLTSSGSVLYTQNADSLGGLLFRNVPPGKG